MHLEQSFDVDAPIERVWSALIDVEHVAPCLPGASITGREEDGGYRGAFSVKIGPTSASYTGRLEMTGVDEAGRTATMKADGTDKRGQGGASATIISRLTETAPGRTRVEVETEYRITGRLARFGRGGMIEDISEKLLRQFAANLQSSLMEPPSGVGPSEPPTPGPPPPPPPPRPPAATTGTAPVSAGAPQPPPPFDAGNVVGGLLAERLRRTPLPVLGAVALVGFLLGRRSRR